MWREGRRRQAVPLLDRLTAAVGRNADAQALIAAQAGVDHYPDDPCAFVEELAYLRQVLERRKAERSRNRSRRPICQSPARSASVWLSPESGPSSAGRRSSSPWLGDGRGRGSRRPGRRRLPVAGLSAYNRASPPMRLGDAPEAAHQLARRPQAARCRYPWL